jgi:hypothetical protein
MKKALIFLAVLGLTASLGAQSVIDLAKREKERRESLKGRHAVVVKNADLLRVKKLPAVEVAYPDAAVGESGTGEAQGVEPATISSDADQAVSPSGSEAPPFRLVDRSASGETLEAQLKTATDLVDLLTTKMNALRQQYEFQDTMVPGSVIQGQIADTGQRLVKAQAQQARIQAELQKSGAGKKNPGSTDR